MKIFISIDGVLRNTIQKFDYHYKDAYLNSEFSEETDFEYNVVEPIKNNNILDSYRFQSKEEFEYFTFIEYPIEIFGHAGLSYSTTFTDLNKMIYENPNNEYTLIGLDEFGKAKPATLFFLSKNGFLGYNIKFSNTDKIKSLWDECDCWITDNEKIISSCPENKIAVKFKTDYNQYFTYNKEISKLTEIDESWLTFTEKHTTLISMELQNDVKQEEQ